MSKCIGNWKRGQILSTFGNVACIGLCKTFHELSNFDWNYKWWALPPNAVLLAYSALDLEVARAFRKIGAGGAGSEKHPCFMAVL